MGHKILSEIILLDAKKVFSSSVMEHRHSCLPNL